MTRLFLLPFLLLPSIVLADISGKPASPDDEGAPKAQVVSVPPQAPTSPADSQADSVVDAPLPSPTSSDGWLSAFVQAVKWDGLPAWIQAIGSIAGILIAIWVPSRFRELERAEKARADHLIARSHALVLHELIRGLLKHSGGLDEFKFTSIGTAWSIPKELIDNKINFHYLGVPGEHLQSAIFILEKQRKLGNFYGRLESAQKAISDYPNVIKAGTDMKDAEELCRDLELAHSNLKQALKGIEALLEPPR